MKIVYLHGLNSDNIGPKNEWLRTIAEVVDPLIDYKLPHIYRTLKEQVISFHPNFLIGSSMGGYFAFEMAKELNLPALLFNPALNQRSMEPDMEGRTKEIYQPPIKVVLGKKDGVIPSEKTIEFLQPYPHFKYTLLEHGHDTPLEVFQEQILLYISSL